MPTRPRKASLPQKLPASTASWPLPCRRGDSSVEKRDCQTRGTLMAKKRVAIGGFMLESNGHSPVAMRDEFEANVLLEGAAMLADLRTKEPRSPVCLQGFYDTMNKKGDWEPV